ncbi:PhzF family phenazine biosynthesis protein [Tistrella mobilis]|uniref:PhzF family phenazine biosynthesis protein n=1 Tax=Tistrella mobilis TaxID=171437 RepID=UPI00355756BD
MMAQPLPNYRPYRFFIVDVFTQMPFNGNQLAVFPDAQGLSTALMQVIAREFNFAETVFIFPPKKPEHTARFRIFTPTSELPFAGHPNLGAAAVLTYLAGHNSADKSHMLVEEAAGVVDLHVDTSSGLFARLTIEPGPQDFPTAPDIRVLAKVLSLNPDLLLRTWFGSAGVPFCFVHISDKSSVDLAVLDRPAWKEHIKDSHSPHIFFFSGSLEPGGSLYARMIAPALGIDEDPATGAAAAALATFLATESSAQEGKFDLEIAQGVALGRPSRITAFAEKRMGRVISAGVGGHVSLVGEGLMRVPLTDFRGSAGASELSESNIQSTPHLNNDAYTDASRHVDEYSIPKPESGD